MIALRSLSGFALIVVTGWFTLSGTAAGEERWATYSNPRFSRTADYPADLFTEQDPPPENGDGATFRTADGRAQLAIYGAYCR